ncbi:2-polyprenyl-6-methoxyphenol hydroxylase-like FAD-dependent oxidoreductase [Micromonospora pisi]|uniref:2-polyprenyl-6-methoxyphenol hydroxylase-like FAD-dependent oxidoreductase n=1 Tax=Micromonospora pisi TaxID=589240 RepID=A0A495JXK6_9ACTN|nr:FAD-dependent monooxygenase [Micromonospora pisi]RKR92994.1 2-polyprenyl-6-methoxyphenol hydroxylase-like FAD-dependent oxidoreductase [Micromonospora pisi]
MPRSDAKVFASISADGDPTAPSVILGRAVVLGGSVGGLLAARVLADYAERVVIIDRDELTAAGAARVGVPQGSQIHALLPAGRAQLERWFPGFSQQAVARGVYVASADVRRTYLDGRLKVRGSDVAVLSASRPFLESLIRGRTLELPNVEVVRGRVTGLDLSATAVTAVRYESMDGPGVEAADLVVDATGRSSRLGDWLARGGWERLPLTRMTININYATATFRRAESEPALGTVLAICSPGASGDIAGAMFTAIEGDRWMVMMGGYGDSQPGRTAEDLVRRLREDFPPEFRGVVESEMLGEVETYRQADSRRRDFHALERFPARLVSVGDAVSSFNPIYGQGMTSAALHASCLARYLSAEPDLSVAAREFFALQRVVVDAAWGISTSADLSRPSVSGPYPRGYRISSWVGNQIQEASVTDPTVARRFDAVTQMDRHPSYLATPGTVLRAIRANWRARRRAGHPHTP